MCAGFLYGMFNHHQHIIGGSSPEMAALSSISSTISAQYLVMRALFSWRVPLHSCSSSFSRALFHSLVEGFCRTLSCQAISCTQITHQVWTVVPAALSPYNCHIHHSPFGMTECSSVPIPCPVRSEREKVGKQ